MYTHIHNKFAIMILLTLCKNMSDTTDKNVFFCVLKIVWIGVPYFFSEKISNLQLLLLTSTKKQATGCLIKTLYFGNIQVVGSIKTKKKLSLMLLLQLFLFAFAMIVHVNQTKVHVVITINKIIVTNVKVRIAQYYIYGITWLSYH